MQKRRTATRHPTRGRHMEFRRRVFPRQYEPEKENLMEQKWLPNSEKQRRPSMGKEEDEKYPRLREMLMGDLEEYSWEKIGTLQIFYTATGCHVTITSRVHDCKTTLPVMHVALQKLYEDIEFLLGDADTKFVPLNPGKKK